MDDLKMEQLVEEQDVDLLDQAFDFETITDEQERKTLEAIEDLIFEYGDNEGFQYFAVLFDNYEWNLDRGPAPFIKELDNRFFIEVQDGHVKRLSIDIDVMALAIEHQGSSISSENSSFGNAGAMLMLPQLDEIYVTGERLASIVDAMQVASFGDGREIDLFVNANIIPGEQENLRTLAKVPEISEIDELPVDYQEQGKKLVGSMTWKASK
jgi:hypothetical protein